MKVNEIMKPGDVVFYSSFGENRRVMVTKVEPVEFDGIMGTAQVWGTHRQVTHIRSTDGTGWSCYNGIAILD